MRAKSCDRARIFADKMDGDDLELRAAMIQAVLTGVAAARYLTEDPVLSHADADDVARVLEPVLRALICPDAPPRASPHGGDATCP